MTTGILCSPTSLVLQVTVTLYLLPWRSLTLVSSPSLVTPCSSVTTSTSCQEGAATLATTTPLHSSPTSLGRKLKSCREKETLSPGWESTTTASGGPPATLASPGTRVTSRPRGCRLARPRLGRTSRNSSFLLC